MPEFFQALKDAFPPLQKHPILMARLLLVLLALVITYSARKWWKPVCKSAHSNLCDRIFSTSRWLRVYQNSNDMAEWKYYTSEVTGRGHTGDDMIWTLVDWPSLKPKDSFTVHGAVGMIDGIHDSQAKLYARWQIVHDPDGAFIGPVPARGLKSKLRRAIAKVLQILASI